MRVAIKIDLHATNRHRLIDTGQCTRDRHATPVNVRCGGGGDSGGRPVTGAKCGYDKQQNLRRCDDSVLLPVSRGRAHLTRSRTSQRRRQPVAMRASLHIFLTGARARLCICVCICVFIVLWRCCKVGRRPSRSILADSLVARPVPVGDWVALSVYAFPYTLISGLRSAPGWIQLILRPARPRQMISTHGGSIICR